MAAVRKPDRYATVVEVIVWSGASALVPGLYPSEVSRCRTRAASWLTAVPFSTLTVTFAGLKLAPARWLDEGVLVVGVEAGLFWVPLLDVATSRTATAPTSTTMPISAATTRPAEERSRDGGVRGANGRRSAALEPARLGKRAALWRVAAAGMGRGWD